MSMAERKTQSRAVKNPVKRKLTRAEKKEIAAVIQAAKGDGKPHTAQQTIPYLQMYPDGICRVTEKKYSKSLVFEDINYQLAQADDKTAIFENWCDFLNYFDASVSVQLSFINQGARKEKAQAAIEIPAQDDAFNSIRKEYADMLKNQLEKGNNGLEKCKYITFSIEADNLAAAKARLSRIETDVLNNFKVLGVTARPMNGQERLNVLHGIFHPEGEPFRFSWDWLVPSGLTTKDFIAPSSFRFGDGRTFRMGRKLGAVKKAVRRAQAEATAGTKSSRLQFTDEELSTPELEKYIKKSDKAADRLDKAKAAIPKEKKLVKERTFDETTGKGKTRLHFEEKDKPPGFKEKRSPLSRPAQEAGILVHNKIHSVEKDNSGVEGAHKSEEAAERGLKYGARKIKQGYRSHKLKPYREAAKAEKAAFRANVDFQYHKTLHENPQLTSNPISRFWQKQKIKRQYAKEARNTAKGIKGAAERTRKAAAKAAEKTKQTAAFVARHPAGVAIAVGVLLLFIMVMSGLSSCGAMFSGTLNGVLGTSYTSEDSDLVEVENSYAGLENELQSRIDNIERDNPGYDEYRYDLENIGHNPHELASYLTAKYQTYTRAEVQSELQRIFNQQYKLTLTEEVEIRYREEERTDTWTDEDGNEHTDTYTVQVPYEYYILNVKLTNTPLSTIAENNLTPEQLEMYRVYLQTSGNKPLITGLILPIIPLGMLPGGVPDGTLPN